MSTAIHVRNMSRVRLYVSLHEEMTVAHCTTNDYCNSKMAIIDNCPITDMFSHHRWWSDAMCWPVQPVSV